jgi:hypothetical protein
MTKKQLIEFLRNKLIDDFSKYRIEEINSGHIQMLADALIKEGFCKVDEPFQITFCRNCNENVTGKIHNSTCKLTILREIEE